MLYIGKFGTIPHRKYVKPILNENGIIHYTKDIEKEEMEESRGIYIPLASFVTSYARQTTITLAQKVVDYSLKKYNKNMFIYSDTDSVHCLLSIDELKELCEIDNIALGKWKHVGTYEKSRFLQTKCYIQGNNNNINVTCAGMSKLSFNQVNFENFKRGFTIGKKITYEHVRGGVFLVEKPFTLKEESLKKEIEKFEI